MRLSPNEILILNVLQTSKKPMERLQLSLKTGISDKNISAKLNSLEDKRLIISRKERVGRSTKRFVQLTKAGRSEKLGKIILEKKKPAKIKIKPKKIEISIEKEIAELKQTRETMIKAKEKHLKGLHYTVSKAKSEKERKYWSKKVSEVAKELEIMKKEPEEPKKPKKIKHISEIELTEEEKEFAKKRGYVLRIREEKPKKPEKITPKALPPTDELVKELELLINIGFTNRPAEYKKIGYKSKSELRAQISMLIGKLRL